MKPVIMLPEVAIGALAAIQVDKINQKSCWIYLNQKNKFELHFQKGFKYKIFLLK